MRQSQRSEVVKISYSFKSHIYPKDVNLKKENIYNSQNVLTVPLLQHFLDILFEMLVMLAMKRFRPHINEENAYVRSKS